MSVFKVKERKTTFLKVRTSGLYCCVPHCSNSSRYTNVSFHIFPNDVSLRAQWLAKIRREHFTPVNCTRVCSRHFLPTDLVISPKGLRLLKKGAVPVLFAWNGYTQPKSRLSVWERRPPPPQTDSPPADPQPVPEEDDVIDNMDHDYCVTAATGAMASELLDDVETLQRRIRELEAQTEKLHLQSRFGLQRIAGSDHQIRFFTRFASYRHFQYFWRLIEPAVTTKMVRITSVRSNPGASSDTTVHHTNTKLPPIDEFLLFLMYLSVGLYPQDLAERFGIHRTTVSRIIATWTNFLYELLGKKRLWLPQEVVQAHLPPEFAAFPDTQVVLDCTEIYCQTPSDLLLQSEVYSTYKSHSTLKAMIGIAPHGAITFISALYAGSTSDREIFKQSGIATLLKPDMAIMVDKGFLVDNLAPCKVYRPAFLSKKSQMSAKDVLQTQSIARLRIHVERCIRRVKENKLFDRVIPVSVCGNIDSLFSLACMLVNYQHGPLVKAWAALN
ncbi:hypothetical protein WMY93_005449 [Mugilogobius chulae]|uniref:THAP-type domain-containing protein n=1 Tax=Mugilogobius chulae TaxID=88201 RepID=A0AAW0PK26_9GOBI